MADAFRGAAMAKVAANRMAHIEITMQSASGVRREVRLRRGQPVHEILAGLSRAPGFEGASGLSKSGVAVHTTEGLGDGDTLVVAQSAPPPSAQSVQSGAPPPTLPRPAARGQPQAQQTENPLSTPASPAAPGPFAQGASMARNISASARTSTRSNVEGAVHMSNAPVKAADRMQTYIIQVYTGKLSMHDVKQEWFEANPSNPHQTEDEFLEEKGVVKHVRKSAAPEDGGESGSQMPMGQGTSPSTDAQPFICLHGEEKDSGNIPLTIQGGEGFAPGGVDDFTVSCPRLGDIKSITIGHDNRGHDAQTSKWKVDQVLVTCMHTQRGRLSGLGDHAKHSGKGLSQQWQFVLHDEESLNSDGVEGKWIGGLGSGDLGVYDLEIEKLRTHIAEMNKKLQHKQRERDAVAASTGSIAATRDIRAEVVITKSHKKQRKACACLFCVLCMVAGGIIGSFINDNTGGMQVTGAVALDVVDTRDATPPDNITEHEVHGRHIQEVGWLVGALVAGFASLAISAFCFLTWKTLLKYRWRIMLAIALLAHALTFFITVFYWIPGPDGGPTQDEENRTISGCRLETERVDWLALDYDPDFVQILLCIVLHGIYAGLALLAMQNKALRVGKNKTKLAAKKVLQQKTGKIYADKKANIKTK